MNILNILAVAMLMAPAASRQIVHVPALVREACSTRFPGAKHIEWKLKTDRKFEAEFTLEGVDIAAKFDSVGRWLETETTIKPSQLAKAVRDELARSFTAYRVVETQSLTRVDDRQRIFEVHLDNGKEIVKVQLDGTGKVLSQSAKPK